MKPENDDFLMKRDLSRKRCKNPGKVMLCHHFPNWSWRLGRNLPLPRIWTSGPWALAFCWSQCSLLPGFLKNVFLTIDVGPLWKALGPVKHVKLQTCVFLFSFYFKTWGKPLFNFDLCILFFNGLAWHIFKLVKYPIGSMGLVYTYLHFPKNQPSMDQYI